MRQLEPGIAASVIGLAAFPLWQVYEASAPTLAEVRLAPPGDISMRQRMLDADITVGSLAVIVGAAFAVLTKDFTAMILMLVILGTLSFWRRATANADSR